MRTKTRTALAALALTALLASSAEADGGPGRLVELVDANGAPFERLEASGVTYWRGRLVVVDDTVNSLFLFDAGGALLGRIDFARFPPVGSKFEDIAFHPPTETYFAVGSHSGTSEDMLERTSVLVEFRLRNRSEIDERAVRTLPLRKSFLDAGMWRVGGMKIEGLAVDEAGHALYVGLREPVDRARVYRVDLDELRRDRTPAELVVEFDASNFEDTPFCVSALVWEPERRGLLILTSTENETTHRFLGNRLWLAVPGDEPQLLLDRFDEGLKAEGLALGSGMLFVVYDNDQDDTGIPSQLRVLALSELPTSSGLAP